MTQPANGTLRWLVARYLASATFRSLDPSTQRVRRQILDHCCIEPVAQGRIESFAEFPLDRLTARALRVLRDRKAALPEAANGRVKALRALFGWAVREDLLPASPARDVELIRSRTVPEWTLEDVIAFEARHPVGTKARLL